MSTFFTSRGLIAKLVAGVSLLILAIIIGFASVNVWIVKKNLRQKHEEMLAREDVKLKAFEVDTKKRMERRMDQTLGILSLTIVDAVYDFVPERALNLMTPFLIDDIRVIYILNENNEWFAGITLSEQDHIQTLSGKKQWPEDMIEASRPLVKDDEPIGKIFIGYTLERVSELKKQKIQEIESKQQEHLKTIRKSVRNAVFGQLMEGFVIFIVLVFSVSLFMIRAIILPITAVKEKVKVLAQGNLDISFAHRSQVPGDVSRTGAESGDEINELVQALDLMAANLRQMIGDISSGVATLTTASVQLANVAQQMASGSSRTSDMAESVATAAKTMTSGMQSAAAYSTEATSNVQLLTEAASEMNNTIGTISTNTDKAQAIVDEIGQFVNIINDMNTIITLISDSVEGQATSTRAITDNISDVAQKLARVHETVTESTAVSRSIDKNIADVNKASHDMADAGSRTNMSSRELSRLAEQLKEMVGRFKL